MKGIKIIAVAIVVSAFFSACKKKNEGMENKLPERISFDVQAVDNDGTITPGGTVVVIKP